MLEMSFAEYRKLPGVNWSLLKHMWRSPLDYYHAATTIERKDTPAMAFGRLVHTAVLEPDEVPRRYVVWDGGIRRGRAWDAFMLANATREIVTADDYTRALAIRDAVRGHKTAGPLLDTGKPERVIQWTDKRTGIILKSRPDWVSDALVDLKTTTEIEGKAFGTHAARLGYHGQMAMYHRGLMADGYPESTPVYIIAVETESPYDCGVFELDEDTLWAGDALVGTLLKRLEACADTNSWPGRYPDVAPFNLPVWAFPEYDERLD